MSVFKRALIAPLVVMGLLVAVACSSPTVAPRPTATLAPVPMVNPATATTTATSLPPTVAPRPTATLAPVPMVNPATATTAATSPPPTVAPRPTATLAPVPMVNPATATTAATSPPPTVAPRPTATLAPVPMVNPATATTAATSPPPTVAPHLATTPTPVSTATPTSLPTQTPPPDKMKEINCQEPCALDTVPIRSSVDWVQKPRISATGELSLIAQIHEEHNLILPGGANGGVSNVALSDGPILYGSVVPPSEPGWDWNPEPGLWIADSYTYQERTLTVTVQIDPAAVTHSDVRVCLWSGGAATEAYVLGCADIERP